MCEIKREHVSKTKTLSRKRKRGRERDIFVFLCEKEKHKNSRLFSSRELYSLRRRRLKSVNRGMSRDNARMLTTIRGIKRTGIKIDKRKMRKRIERFVISVRQI